VLENCSFLEHKIDIHAVTYAMGVEELDRGKLLSLFMLT